MDLEECKRQAADTAERCTAYHCDWSDPSGSLHIANAGQIAPLQTRCFAENKQYYTPKACPACPVPDPIVLDGVPIKYEMQSFAQPYEQCRTPEDDYNDAIKARNLWGQRGKQTLDERPVYKRCLPDKVMLTRTGTPQSLDGIAETAENIRSIPEESELLGLGRLHTEGDTATQDLSGRQVCAEKRMMSKAHPTAGLIEVYGATSVQPDLYSRQLYSSDDPALNSNFKRPLPFRNMTKSRMNTNRVQ